MMIAGFSGFAIACIDDETENNVIRRCDLERIRMMAL